jgi:hypothetical protein
MTARSGGVSAQLFEAEAKVVEASAKVTWSKSRCLKALYSSAAGPSALDESRFQAQGCLCLEVMFGCTVQALFKESRRRDRKPPCVMRSNCTCGDRERDYG